VEALERSAGESGEPPPPPKKPPPPPPPLYVCEQPTPPERMLVGESLY
jgi:hypothetical protein